MVTDRGLAALRTAATVNHLYPTLTTRLHAGGAGVVTVVGGHDRTEATSSCDESDGGLVLSPCGFRAATARAWAQHRAGRRLRLLDLDCDPEVLVDTAPGDAIWANGVVRVRTHDAEQVDAFVFGTFLSPDRCRFHGRDLIDDVDAPDGLLGLTLQRDSDTEVTVVAAEVDPDRTPMVQDEVLAIVEGLVARYAVVELLDTVAATEGSRPSS